MLHQHQLRKCVLVTASRLVLSSFLHHPQNTHLIHVLVCTESASPWNMLTSHTIVVFRCYTLGSLLTWWRRSHRDHYRYVLNFFTATNSYSAAQATRLRGYKGDHVLRISADYGGGATDSGDSVFCCVLESCFWVTATWRAI